MICDTTNRLQRDSGNYLGACSRLIVELWYSTSLSGIRYRRLSPKPQTLSLKNCPLARKSGALSASSSRNAKMPACSLPSGGSCTNRSSQKSHRAQFIIVPIQLYMEGSKNWGVPFGGFYSQDENMLGSILRSPGLCKLPCSKAHKQAYPILGHKKCSLGGPPTQ